MEISDHLFRREAGRMVAALTRVFGVQNLALAEDVVQDAFCRALEVWKYRGVPDNPSAWLMATAKNRALDLLRRQRTARTFAPELGRLLDSEWTRAPVIEELFSADAIKDDLLRMMFSCCHPRLSEEAQVALILNILCGFGVEEIAAAFVSGHAAIEKRITRAKKILAGSRRLFDLTAPVDFSKRLPAVQRALYLLFSEGYHGASPETAVRAGLCHEAMRLAALLLQVETLVVGLVLQDQEGRHPAADAELLTVGRHQRIEAVVVQGQQRRHRHLGPGPRGQLAAADDLQGELLDDLLALEAAFQDQRGAARLGEAACNH